MPKQWSLRKLDSERLEEMLLSLQTGIRQGDPRSVEVGVKVLAHKAELNGYKAPTRIDMNGTHLIQQQEVVETQLLADLSRLTTEELREYRRLEWKVRGLNETSQIEANNNSDTPLPPQRASNANTSDRSEGGDNG